MTSSPSKSDIQGYQDSGPQPSDGIISWEETLFVAINHGDVRAVRSLLKKGVNVNSTHPSGRTPLGMAAHLGNVEILKVLLELCSNSCYKGKRFKKPRKLDSGVWDQTSPISRHVCKERKTAEKRTRGAGSLSKVYDFEMKWSNIRNESFSSEDDSSDDVDSTRCNRRRLQKELGRLCDKQDEILIGEVKNRGLSEVSSDISAGQSVCLSDSEGKGRKNKKESNQGYFIVVHNEYTSPEKTSDSEMTKFISEDNFSEVRTPDDMDNLEWDSELQVQECCSTVEETEKSDSWGTLYRWYADYLSQSCAVGMSSQHLRPSQIDVNQLDMYRRSAMHYAAEQGNVQILKVLQSAGCSVDVGDSDDVTPLHLAAARDYPDAVEFLILCGAKVNRKSIDGTGPLHMAAARGFTKTAEILLSHGACVDALDRSDRTPLLLAVSRGLVGMVELLISHGARVNVEDILGYSPLCQAVWQQEKEIVQMLLEAGARLTHSDRLLHCSILHRCPDIAKLLISAGSIVNLRDDSGDTPLIIAARTGQVNMVNLLLKNGALPSYVNGLTGSTPLHEAVESLRPAQYSTFKDILISLLNYRGPAKLLNFESSSTLDTPLARALVHNKDHAMILLIQYGADVNLLQQHTPIVSETYLKKRPNRLIIAQLMVSAGLKMWNYNQDIKVGVQYVDDSPASWIASMKFNPMSLCSLSRLRFRLHHGENLNQAVVRSGLPVRLKKYIMLQDIVDVDHF